MKFSGLFATFTVIIGKTGKGRDKKTEDQKLLLLNTLIFIIIKYSYSIKYLLIYPAGVARSRYVILIVRFLVFC